MLGVERQSSIEKEPRTLNNNQIDFAREAALYVVNTRSIQEALNIFTQGLEPVVTCAEDEDEDEDSGNGELAGLADQIHANVSIYRDIVSAPF